MANKQIKTKSNKVYNQEQNSVEKLSYNEICYGEKLNKEPDYRKRDLNLFANSYMDYYDYDEWN